jgi:hypothetical protein
MELQLSAWKYLLISASPKPTQPENGRADSNLVRRSAEKNCRFFYRHSPRNLHAQVIVIDV